jgi:hypothetical protein
LTSSDVLDLPPTIMIRSFEHREPVVLVDHSSPDNRCTLFVGRSTLEALASDGAYRCCRWSRSCRSRLALRSRSARPCTSGHGVFHPAARLARAAG